MRRFLERALRSGAGRPNRWSEHGPRLTLATRAGAIQTPMIRAVMSSSPVPNPNSALAILTAITAVSAATGLTGWWWWVRWKGGKRLLHTAQIERRCAQLGWGLELGSNGLTIYGRSLSRRWLLVAGTSGDPGSVIFTLGAPDLEQALALFCARQARGDARQQSPEFMRTTPAQRVGSRALLTAFAVHAKDRDEAQRFLSPAVERLLIGRPQQEGYRFDPSLRIWICPHGVQIMSARSAVEWLQLRHLIRLGLTIGMRSGFP